MMAKASEITKAEIWHTRSVVPGSSWLLPDDLMSASQKILLWYWRYHGGTLPEEKFFRKSNIRLRKLNDGV